MTKSNQTSPQDRLAANRRLIVRYMRDGESESSSHQTAGVPGYNTDGHPLKETGNWQFFKNAVHTWWQHHPAQLALALGKPALSRYAEKKPLRLLGIAAGAGAAAVWIRPWRLVSITSLLVATVKSSEVSALVLSLLSRYTTTKSKENHD